MRIAIIHDALCVPGGAERLALWMAWAFPDAPFFTTAYLPDNTFPEFKSLDVRILPGARRVKSEKQFKRLFPLWLFGLRRLKFEGFDRVLSSSTYLAKFIRPPRVVEHRAYIHAPFRLLWKPDSYTPSSLPLPSAAMPFVRLLLPALRRFDLRHTQSIPRIATSCRNVARQIEENYARSATIINPPVDLSAYPLASQPGEYFLTVSRLISHKRIDLAVEACNRLGHSLVVVGEGPERARLESLAGPTVRLVGRVSDAELKEYYRNCRALIFPSDEDYGIVPLEAQACGRPVLAYGHGGVLETVQEGVSGLFFPRQEPEDVASCLRAFEQTRFDPARIRAWASQFDAPQFIEKIRAFMLQD